jgi:hypothetical protein
MQEEGNMIATNLPVYHRQSTVSRVLALPLLLAACIASPRPASAGYDWCSTDPVFSFSLVNSVSTYALDLQAQVPLSALPLADTARLNAVIPTNATATAATVGTPGFSLDTSVSPVKAQALTLRYSVDFVFFVPASTTNSFPIRLVITDPQRLTQVVVNGTAGQPLRVSVDVGS